MIKNKIGFIGIGVMGESMAINLLKEDYSINVYTRTKSKAKNVVEKGAIWKDTIKDCVSDRDIIITMVGMPEDVENVYFGQEGIIENVSKGTILIDMTTTSPKLSKLIYDKALEKGIYALDAPVSGGDTGAKNATLSIMVGGDKNIFDQALSLFNVLGNNIIYEGPAGYGQHTKMANQIAIAGTIAGVTEALRYGMEMGLDLELMLKSIDAGAAGSWQMSNMAPRILKDDFDPGFYIKHFIKDMSIANNESKEISLNLEVLENVLDMYKSLSNKGLDELGTQALIKYYKN